MNTLLVLVVHLCTVTDVVPFLTDCRPHVFPIKAQTMSEAKQKCEAEKKVFGKEFKNYFSKDRPNIKNKEIAIVGPMHCELDPERDWQSRAGNFKMDPTQLPLGNGKVLDATKDEQKDSERDIQKELNEVSPMI